MVLWRLRVSAGCGMTGEFTLGPGVLQARLFRSPSHGLVPQRPPALADVFGVRLPAGRGHLLKRGQVSLTGSSDGIVSQSF